MKKAKQRKRLLKQLKDLKLQEQRNKLEREKAKERKEEKWILMTQLMISLQMMTMMIWTVGKRKKAEKENRAKGE